MENVVQTEVTSSENFLHQISLFEKCSPYTISKLAVRMRKQTFNKGETVLFQGMIANQLYMVASGMVGVSSRKEKVSRFLANLEKGSYFGEISLVKNCAATATVKAVVDPTEVYILDHEVIHEVLQDFPEAKMHLEEKIRERNRLRLEAFEKQESAGAAPLSAANAN
jgi:CRP-like cAMP-binding protein